MSSVSWLFHNPLGAGDDNAGKVGNITEQCSTVQGTVQCSAKRQITVSCVTVRYNAEHCTLCIVQCTVYSVHCSLYTVHCAL